MDVFEDVAVILRVMLDYIGIDADDMAEYLQQLNVRQREGARQFGHYVANRWNQQVIQRHLLMSQRWHKWRSDIRHRSLIRCIGTSLPLKPPKRLKIQSHLLRSRRHRHDSFESDTSFVSLRSLGTTETDEEVIWVEEDLGDNRVRIRAKNKKDMSDTCDSESEGNEDELFSLRPDDAPLMNSTMISSVSMMSSNDPTAMLKINALEDELSNLRNQIATLVLNQEQINKSQVSLMEPKLEALESPNVSTPIKIPPCVMAPPPPPPPPPPPLMLQCKNAEETCSVRKQNPEETCSATKQIPLKQRKDCINSDTQGKNNKPDTANNTQPTLSDVLKGLGSVKLRSIQRSPGGTPVKSKRPVAQTENSDPASLIAQALKKKFSHQMFHSPEVDKENESHDFSSADENSPHLPKNSHLKKISKRRSLLFEERRKSATPLRDLNLQPLS